MKMIIDTVQKTITVFDGNTDNAVLDRYLARGFTMTEQQIAPGTDFKVISTGYPAQLFDINQMHNDVQQHNIEVSGLKMQLDVLMSEMDLLKSKLPVV